MIKKTQKERVVDRINEEGYVDNFWAFHNYILRLGAIIHDLSQEGWEFKRAYGKELGYDREVWKNFYYIPTKRPDNTLFGVEKPQKRQFQYE